VLAGVAVIPVDAPESTEEAADELDDLEVIGELLDDPPEEAVELPELLPLVATPVDDESTTTLAEEEGGETIADDEDILPAIPDEEDNILAEPVDEPTTTFGVASMTETVCCAARTGATAEELAQHV